MECKPLLPFPLQKFYLELRKHRQSPDSTPITTRQLESLIRLTEVSGCCPTSQLVASGCCPASQLVASGSSAVSQLVTSDQWWLLATQ